MNTSLPLLKGKVLFITGSSRGIGKAIALRAARDGAKIAIVAKTSTPDPRIPGTIYDTAEEVKKLGGEALPIVCDIRFEDQIKLAIEKTVFTFGNIDIVINNASAISLKNTLHTESKKFDLMHQINVRGTFLICKYAIPHLEKASNPHILVMSPPLSLQSKWFSESLAYTMSKYGMSMITLGLAEELKTKGIAVNSLWPKTIINTAALQAISRDSQSMGASGRTPEIVADAAYVIINQPSREYTGNFTIDEDILRSQGLTNFDKYSVSSKNTHLLPDFFLEEDYSFQLPPKKDVLSSQIETPTTPPKRTSKI